MFSPITPSSSQPTVPNSNVPSRKAGKAAAIASVRPTRTVDSVRFSGPQKEAPKQESAIKKYFWPVLELATGATVAFMGIPIHLIPGIGNVVGLGMNIVGGLMAAHALYWIYQKANAKGNTAESAPGAPTSAAQPPAAPAPTPPQNGTTTASTQSPTPKPQQSGTTPRQATSNGGPPIRQNRQGNGMLQNLGSNMISGAGFGLAAGAGQEGVHAGVEAWKHRNDDKDTPAEAGHSEAHHETASAHEPDPEPNYEPEHEPDMGDIGDDSGGGFLSVVGDKIQGFFGGDD